MGTRGAFGFRLDGKDKIAYNHWDSYPDGLGCKVVNWLVNINQRSSLDDLFNQVSNLRVIDGETAPTEAEKEYLKEFADTGVGRQSLDDWYCLLRGAQPDNGPAIMLKAGVMLDGADFLLDSLFCEWAYIVNLDTMMFEAYRGYQTKKHHQGRYAEMSAMPSRSIDTAYYPVALVGTYDILKVKEWKSTWVKEVSPLYDDE